MVFKHFNQSWRSHRLFGNRIEAHQFALVIVTVVAHRADDRTIAHLVFGLQPNTADASVVFVRGGARLGCFAIVEHSKMSYLASESEEVTTVAIELFDQRREIVPHALFEFGRNAAVLLGETDQRVKDEVVSVTMCLFGPSLPLAQQIDQCR